MQMRVWEDDDLGLFGLEITNFHLSVRVGVQNALEHINIERKIVTISSASTENAFYKQESDMGTRF